MNDLVYPKGERVFTGYYNRKGDLLFIITAKESRDFYFLYELKDGVFKKLGRAKNPPELTERFGVYQKMREVSDD